MHIETVILVLVIAPFPVFLRRYNTALPVEICSASHLQLSRELTIPKVRTRFHMYGRYIHFHVVTIQVVSINYDLNSFAVSKKVSNRNNRLTRWWSVVGQRSGRVDVYVSISRYYPQACV